MITVPNNDSKEQFNIQLSPDLKRRLKDLAVRFNKGKATKVGADIIETYIELWAEMEALKEQTVKEQQAQMSDVIKEQFGRRHPPLVHSELSRAARPGRKTKQ